MHNDKQDKNLLERVSRELSGQAEGLDPAICARLRHARIQAVETGRATSLRQRIRQWWCGEGLALHPLWPGLAAAVTVAVVVSLWPTQEKQGSSAHLVLDFSVQGGESVVGPMDVLMSNEDMDLLENLDLYEWLAAEYG